MQTHRPVISDLILINSFLFLNGNTSGGRIWVAAQKEVKTAAVLTTPLVRPQSKGARTASLHLAENHMSPAHLLLYAFLKETLNFLKGLLLQPIPEIVRPTPSHTELSYHMALSVPVLPGYLECHRSPHLPESFMAPLSDLSQQVLHFSDVTSPETSPVNTQVSPAPNLQISPTPFLSPEKNAQGMKKQKRKQQATRRSQRIQERCKTSSTLLDNPKKSKVRPASIPLFSDSTQDKLDTDQVFRILQATGLEITTHVEQMIEDAIKQDNMGGAPDRSAPTTPLHNPVPLLAVPDFELPL